MSTSGHLVYRCLRCSNVVCEQSADIDADLASLLARFSLPRILHTCDTGNRGVCGLVGAHPDRPGSPE